MYHSTYTEGFMRAIDMLGDLCKLREQHQSWEAHYANATPVRFDMIGTIGKITERDTQFWIGVSNALKNFNRNMRDSVGGPVSCGMRQPYNDGWVYLWIKWE